MLQPTGDPGGSNQEEEVSLQTGQANEEEIDVETEEVLNNTAGENDTSKPGTTPVADISQSNIGVLIFLEVNLRSHICAQLCYTECINRLVLYPVFCKH